MPLSKRTSLSPVFSTRQFSCTMRAVGDWNWFAITPSTVSLGVFGKSAAAGPRFSVPSDMTVASKSPSLKRYHAAALLPIMASLASALKASKAAAERAPAAELITKARRFMDVTFSLDMLASFTISGPKAKYLGLKLDE